MSVKNKTEENWITAETACELLSIKLQALKLRCRKGLYIYRVQKSGSNAKYDILQESLPIKRNIDNIDEKNDLEYSNAPLWAKAQAEKYISIIRKSENLRGLKLREFITEWNEENPNYRTSYTCFLRMRKRFEQFGINGLLARYGKSKPKANMKDEYYSYFKALFLKEGSPSLQTCWDITLGYAIRTTGIDKQYFPSRMTFLRRLEKELSKSEIYLARNGKTKWNRKYGSYIVRDYSDILCGQVWVSDHAQIDIACLTEDGNIVFPWVTAWRDFKSGKWLGWILQTGSPNSDLIFQSFYYAANEWGLPKDVIIDNGKDYRSKDFAGGRKNRIKVDTNETKTTSMLAELNVEVHFALPYNAQTKPIERDFLKIKGLLSKHCVGYRGGNVVERPEKLSKEVKCGKILPFGRFKEVFDDFIINVLNKKPSQGKNLNGLSPDQLFDEEFNIIETPSKDALKLFCMRTSKTYTIGRNGINDRQLGIFYWADWLINNTGLKIYMRRDIQNYKEAWVFRADNDEFVGKVTAVKAVAALYADKISKEEFKTAMANKKRDLKIAQEAIKQTLEIPIEEINENYKAAYKTVERTNKSRVSKIANTNMDKVIQKSKEMEKIGRYDMTAFNYEKPTKPTKKLYLYETDKILDEELKGVAYGS